MKERTRLLKKATPSKRISNAVEELLEQVTKGYLREFLRLDQQLLEGEAENFLGRDYDQLVS